VAPTPWIHLGQFCPLPFRATRIGGRIVASGSRTDKMWELTLVNFFTSQLAISLLAVFHTKPESSCQQI
jgi:hypothetical protein